MQNFREEPAETGSYHIRRSDASVSGEYGEQRRGYCELERFFHICLRLYCITFARS